MKDLRIALVVMTSPVGETGGNLDRMARWVARAVKGGAKLVCFPEMNITGYSSREEIQKVAEPIPGDASRRVSSLATREGITILAGMAERETGNLFFASHLVATPDGAVQVYRKTHIAPPEKQVFSSGQIASLFEISDVRFGIQLCYDAHFPGLSTRMAVKGADVIFLPHASPRGTPEGKLQSWMRHLSARAFDNGLFVAAVNQTGDNGLGLSFPGMAVVIGPDGEVLCQDVSGNEGILFADLKSDVLAHVRRHPMRYFLPNRRPEIYAD
ncbi:MAG: nitrilase-related carbon-nitrogen hydrolase [Pseudomonadota bacterium]